MRAGEAAREREQVGVGLDRVEFLEARERAARDLVELRCREVLGEELLELGAFEPEDAVLERRMRVGALGALANHRRAEREAMGDPALLEPAALVEVRVDDRLRLPDQLVALGAVERRLERCDGPAERLDAVEPGAAALVHAAEEAVSGPLGDRVDRLQVRRVQQRTIVRRGCRVWATGFSGSYRSPPATRAGACSRAIPGRRGGRAARG
jgi:hypothetical protein